MYRDYNRIRSQFNDFSSMFKHLLLLFSLRRLVIMSRLTPSHASANCRKFSYLSRTASFASSTTNVGQNQNRSQKNRRLILANPPPAVIRHYSQFQSTDRSNLLSIKPTIGGQRRRFVGWVPAVLRSVLKIRYLILGGAIGGGASLAKVFLKSFWIR